MSTATDQVLNIQLHQMGILSSLFSNKNRVSAHRFGELLGEVVRDTLAEQFDEHGVQKTRQRFEGKGWKFNYARYSFETMSMYVRIANLMMISEYAEHSHVRAMAQSFTDSLPQEYIEQDPGADARASIQFIGSDRPLLTISRLAAQRYFGKEQTGMEQVMHFAASAKAFQGVLNTFQDELELR